MDYNIENYDIDELYAIVGTEDPEEIEKNLTILFNQVAISAVHNKAELMTFLTDVKDRLLGGTEDEPVLSFSTVNQEKINDRLILIDSFYRSNDSGSETNFIIELKTPLYNVTSIRLYSYSIPYSFYNIDTTYGNDTLTCQGELMQVPSGRYTIDNFLTAVNTLILQYGSFAINSSTGKLTFTCSSDQSITFFFNNNTINNQFNTSLGYLMGFRTQTISGETFTAQCVLNLVGPKYFVLDIDDYNNSARAFFGTASNTSSSIPLPSYYVEGSPQTITFPRTLTQAQIYTIQELLKQQQDTSGSTFSEPLATASNIFAVIPFKHNETFSTINVEFGGSLQENKRVYNGPVTITNLRIKLFDDKNNLLNLNGIDWSFILLAQIK